VARPIRTYFRRAGQGLRRSVARTVARAGRPVPFPPWQADAVDRFPAERAVTQYS